MAYRRGNYTFAVEDTYDPFSMQEVFYPVGLYKQEYDKSQEKYLDTLKKTNAFAYLDQTLPEDSEARQIFDTYTNDLRKSAEDFSRNGMSMGNQSALLALQGRYSGEIGRLEKADTAMQEEKKRQLALNANDPTTIFATNNFNIDDFLDNKTPDQYSVSGTKLYERGMQIGASDSARIWSDPKVMNVNKYYQDIYTATGRDPRVLAKWRSALESIPELNDALNSTLKEFGVTDHLKGNDYDRAKESVINGIMNGSVYKRNDSVQQNLGVLTAAQEESKRQFDKQYKVNLAQNGFKEDSNGNIIWDENIDPSFQKAAAVARLKAGNKPGRSGSTSHKTMSKKAINIEWTGNDPSENSYDPNDITASATSADEVSGTPVSYDDLPPFAKKQVNKYIKDGNFDYYDYYYTPYKGGIFNDTEANVTIVPRDVVTDDADDDDFSSIFSATGK